MVPCPTKLSHEARRAAIQSIVEENRRGGQSLVALVTDMGRRDGKVVCGAAATVSCGWGDETSNNQAYELGEGVVRPA